MGETFEVDPWRFTGKFLRNFLSNSIPDTPRHDPIPWTPLAKPIGEARVALLSTAGISMRDDSPFDMDYERQHPTRGDGSYRRIRADATSDTIDVNHLHIETRYIEEDINVALPLDRLRERVEAGRVGAIADTHYSIMGYQGNDSSRLVEESAPGIAADMRNEEVDLALLAPV